MPTLISTSPKASRLSFILLGLLLLLATGCGQEARSASKPSFLWSIEKEDTQAWLFGTMHVSDPQVTTLSTETEAAFQAAEALYTEIEATPDVGAKMAQAGMLAEGETLQRILPADLFTRLETYSTSRGIPVAGFQGLQPWMVSLQLTQIDVLPYMRHGEALDVLLMKRARMSGKHFGSVETIEEQVETLSTGSLEDHIHMLGITVDRLLEEQAQGIVGFEQLLAHYLSGDAEALWDFAMTQTDLSDPIQDRAWQALLVDRNLRMAQRVDAILQEHPDRPTLFAFGALHFLGPESVGVHLEGMGYTVTRVPFGTGSD